MRSTQINYKYKTQNNSLHRYSSPVESMLSRGSSGLLLAHLDTADFINSWWNCWYFLLMCRGWHTANNRVQKAKTLLSKDHFVFQSLLHAIWQTRGADLYPLGIQYTHLRYTFATEWWVTTIHTYMHSFGKYFTLVHLAHRPLVCRNCCTWRKHANKWRIRKLRKSYLLYAQNLETNKTVPTEDLVVSLVAHSHKHCQAVPKSFPFCDWPYWTLSPQKCSCILSLIGTFQ